MHVLVAEDDRRLASFLQKGFQEKGLVADVATDGEQAAMLAMTGLYDAVVLDLMLPVRSGFDVIRQLRAEGVRTPIICLTARDRLNDRVAALWATRWNRSTG